MSFECEDCGNIFSQSDCLCEDWNDQTRSFGCPQCGTFYQSVPDRDKAKLWIDGLVSGGVSVPVGLLFGNAITNGDTVAMFLSGTIMVTGFFVMLLKSGKVFQRMEKSGYKAASKS